MTEKELDLSETLEFGWNTMKANLWFFVVVILIYLGIYAAFVIRSVAAPGNWFVEIVFAVAFQVIFTIIGMGMIKITLKLVDGQKPEYSDLFSTYPLFFRFFVASILLVLMTLLGYMSLIIPGIIVTLQFGMFGYLIVDKNMGGISSLQKISKLTNGAKWKLFGLSALSLLINILGLVCLVIGLFVTIPTTMLAWTFAYRKLLSQTSL